MASVNKVILVGYVGQNPEIRYTSSGEAVVNLSLATSEQWSDRQTGEKREATEWHRIGIFGKPAEIAAKYISKGSPLYVEGKIRSKKYTDKNGIERVAFEIISDQFKMLGKASESADYKAAPKAAPATLVAPQATKNSNDSFDDDIPW